MFSPTGSSRSDRRRRGCPRAIALAGVALAYEEVRQPAAWVATGLFVYLASGLLVGLAGAHDEVTTQTSQLALSGFWGCLGFAAIVAGLSGGSERSGSPASACSR